MRIQNCSQLCLIIFMVFVGFFELHGQDVEILGSGQIMNVKDPIAPQDAATKAYVDNMLLNFGVSLGSAGIQSLLNTGFTPLDILGTGVSKDSIYGKTYQGGLIFYIDDLDTIPGINGFVSAPVDQSAGSEWGCNEVDLPDVPNVTNFPPTGPGAELGDGMTNTSAILSVGNCLTAPAAVACTGYMGGSFNDWFLPSAKELYEMHVTIGAEAPAPNTNIGGFIPSFYLSSTEIDDITARSLSFSPFGDYADEDKDCDQLEVRAIRAF